MYIIIPQNLSRLSHNGESILLLKNYLVFVHFIIMPLMHFVAYFADYGFDIKVNTENNRMRERERERFGKKKKFHRHKHTLSARNEERERKWLKRERPSNWKNCYRQFSNLKPNILVYFCNALVVIVRALAHSSIFATAVRSLKLYFDNLNQTFCCWSIVNYIHSTQQRQQQQLHRLLFISSAFPAG